jgi:hypothetical protein
MSNIGPEEERFGISLLEKVAFLDIIRHETHKGPRSLISRWATPGNTNPNADHALTLTLAAMWRGNERQEQKND